MKIERLMTIMIILLQNRKVTASSLAERFQVSKRTIYRDITDLCLAGIPIITTTGNDGGIMICEDYKISKTLFTEKELQAIFTGLLSLDSVAADQKYQNIMEKFLNEHKDSYRGNHILINLSSHYKETLAPKIDQIQRSIETLHKISFDYYNASGERLVILDPYMVVFQWSSWYVFGFDVARDDFRMYKLNRLWNLNILDEAFTLRTIPSDKLDFNGYFTDECKAVILFDPSMKYRLIDEYGPDCYTEQDDGMLYFIFPFTDKEYMINWLLGFGEKAELVEPLDMRKEVKQRIQKLSEKYEGY